jgi:hypothetical protein
MRGRGRHLSNVIGDALPGRSAADGARLAAAVAEVLGPRLAREASTRGLTADGRILVVARSAEWAEQLRAVSAAVVERVNVRLGRVVATGLEVRVSGPGDARR